MNCPNCGTVNQNGETFCNNCGQRLSVSEEVTNNKNKSNVIISIIFAVLGIFLWLLIYVSIGVVFHLSGFSELMKLNQYMTVLLFPGGLLFGILGFVISYNKQK